MKTRSFKNAFPQNPPFTVLLYDEVDVKVKNGKFYRPCRLYRRALKSSRGGIRVCYCFFPVSILKDKRSNTTGK